MKVQFILPLTLVVSVALVTVMKTRKRDAEKDNKRNMFIDIKLRVTKDVLREYIGDRDEAKKLLDKNQREHEAQEEEVNKVWVDEDKTTHDLYNCRIAQKATKNEVAKGQIDLKNLEATLVKEKASWETELETLKKQLTAPSQVCNFLKKDSHIATSKLCSTQVIVEVPKPEEPKPEEPKPAEPKPEEPKPEEPKPEAPKPEEPKPEAPKPEEPKPEAPKPEEPKPEAPKPEEPKPEAPKQEEPKQ